MILRPRPVPVKESMSESWWLDALEVVKNALKILSWSFSLIPSPLSENSKGQRINIPSLSAIHYNNTSDLELVEDLNTKKENVSKAFIRVDNEIVFDPNSNYIPLKDLYHIINIDSSNAEQETAKLQNIQVQSQQI